MRPEPIWDHNLRYRKTRANIQSGYDSGRPRTWSEYGAGGAMKTRYLPK